MFSLPCTHDHQVLHNPFKNRRLDVAHETIGNGIRRLSRAMATTTGYLPPLPLAERGAGGQGAGQGEGQGEGLDGVGEEGKAKEDGGGSVVIRGSNEVASL